MNILLVLFLTFAKIGLFTFGGEMMVIETERLLLREMTENDFDALYQVLADSDIMSHYPYTFDDARVRGWIDKNIERYRTFGFGLWAVCLKETGEMIGDCGLTMQVINGQIKPEIGYHLRADKQRNHVAGECRKALRNRLLVANVSKNTLKDR